jgi:hypothetical protein
MIVVRALMFVDGYQPEAAMLGVAEAGSGQGFISRGPGCHQAGQGTTLEPGRAGITSFQSLSNEDKSATVYVPFLAGSKKKVWCSELRRGMRKGRSTRGKSAGAWERSRGACALATAYVTRQVGGQSAA